MYFISYSLLWYKQAWECTHVQDTAIPASTYVQYKKFWEVLV
jgi:hypothetical protein